MNGTATAARAVYDPRTRTIGPQPRVHSLYGADGRDDTTVRENWQIYREYRDGYGAYRAQMEDDFLFAQLGRQYTTQQEQQLAAEFQAPLIFNNCRRIGEQYIAHVLGRTPRMTALPRMAGSRSVAQMISDILAYIWYVSRGNRTVGIAVSDMVFRGQGALYGFVDPNADYGRGDVVFDWLHPGTVFWDLSTRDPHGETAENCVISFLSPRSKLAQMHPDFRSVIESASADTSDEDYISSSYGNTIGSYGFAYGDRLKADRDALRIIIRQTKVLQEMTMVLDPVTEEPIGLFERKDEKKVRGFVEQWDQLIRQQFPKASGLDVPIRHVNVWRVREVKSLTTNPSMSRRQAPGSALLADRILPIDRYSIIPLFNVDTGNPFPPSEIRDLKEPQKFLNVMMAKLVKNVSGLAGGGRTYVHEESGAYEEMLEKQNLPNATILWRGDQHMKPFAEPPGQLPAGLMQLAMMGRSWMDGVSGMSESLQGMPGGDRESARLRSLRGEEASRRPDQKLKIVESALAELGRVLVQLAQAFYTGPKVFSLSDEAGEVRQFAINQGRGTSGLSAGLPMHRSVDGKTLYGSINVGQYSVVIAPGSTRPTNRGEQLQEAMAIGQIVAANPAAAKMIFDAWDHPKAAEYAAEFGQVAKLQQALGELQDQLKKTERRLFVAENETRRAREQTELSQLRGDIETVMASLKAKLATVEKGVAITAGRAESEIKAASAIAKADARRLAKESEDGTTEAQ